MTILILEIRCNVYVLQQLFRVPKIVTFLLLVIAPSSSSPYILYALVLTRSQILDNLWGLDASILDRTIDTYIKNLRKKLKTDNIITVKGIGYKYEADK